MSGSAPGALSAPHIRQFSAPPAGWDDFVSSADGSTFCHLSGWGRVMQEVFGHRCIYLVAQDEAGVWRGVLPLVWMRSPLTGRHLISMPYLNDGGPLGDQGARAALALHAMELARQRGVKLLEIRSRKEIGGGVPSVVRKVSVHLPLPEKAEDLWELGLRSNRRSQIRRAMKQGMEARFGPDQLNAFYQVFARNMRDLGTPVLPRRFFERIAEIFPGLVIFAVVRHEGKAVGGACGFLWRDEFEITWASTVREYNPFAPNMLLYWSLMAEVIARGARRFNFGRCTPGSTTHEFKLRWGGADMPLPWLQWPPSADGGAASADSRLMQLAARTWQRLPVPVTNVVGPVLACHLPWY